MMSLEMAAVLVLLGWVLRDLYRDWNLRNWD